MDVGNVLRAADGTRSLTLITQMRPIAVDFSVPQEQRLAEIRTLSRTEGAEIEVRPSRGEAPSWTSASFTLLGDSIDAKTGSITIRAECANQDEQLWPGQLVDVRVILGELRDVSSWYSQQAIRATGSGPAVFVVDRDSRGARVLLSPVGIQSDGRALDQ